MDKWFLQNPDGKFYAIQGWVPDHRMAMGFSMEGDAKSYGLAQKLIGATAVRRPVAPSQPHVNDGDGARRIFGYGQSHE